MWTKKVYFVAAHNRPRSWNGQGLWCFGYMNKATDNTRSDAVELILELSSFQFHRGVGDSSMARINATEWLSRMCTRTNWPRRNAAA